MMSYDDNPVNFCPIFSPVKRIGILTELKPKVSDYSIVFPPSSPNTQPVFYDCSQVLKFAPTPDKLVLKHAFFCRVRYCPVCQWRRSLLWRAVMFQQLPAIKEKYPAYRWVFLTLTVKNPHVTDLRETLKAMNSAWQRMAETKRFKGVVKGFIRTTEVTRAKMAK